MIPARLAACCAAFAFRSSTSIYPFSSAFAINHAASHRHVFSVSNWDESLTVIPTGNSGLPASKNYCDQTNLYINMKYHPELFSEENVKKNGKYIMLVK